MTILLLVYSRGHEVPTAVSMLNFQNQQACSAPNNGHYFVVDPWLCRVVKLCGNGRIAGRQIMAPNKGKALFENCMEIMALFK